MKLKRDQLKKILKECILELLQEGAFNTIIGESLATKTTNAWENWDAPEQQANLTPLAQQPQIPNPMLPNTVGQGSPAQRLQEIARMTAAKQAHGDPQKAKMLTAIFEDTARTTLQREIAAGGVRGAEQLFTGDPDAGNQAAADKAQIEALSGGSVSRWATVAFAQNKK